MDQKPDDLRRAFLTVLPLLGLAPSANGQDPVKVQATSFRVAFENDKLRVLEYNSRPGMGVCGNGMHSHPAHLTVLVSGASVRIKTPAGKVIEQTDVPAGRVFWSEAETHIVENISGNNIRSLIIELKAAPA